jgi:hypothetical protein
VHFIAFPARPVVIGATIESALTLLRERFGVGDFQTWRETDIAGQFITTQILSQIERGDGFVADIIELNFNVTYEIGYAIGKRKKLLLTRYTPIASTSSDLAELGVFDTIGYRNYENSDQLAELLRGMASLEPLQIPNVALNRSAPLYLIEARYKTDPVTRIISRIKKARLFFRSFDPNEQPRLSAFDAIQQVTQSYGVLLHLLPARIDDARIHNLRVAFLAGLAAALERVLLLLQDGDEPIPIDYRDVAVPFRHPSQIDEAIADFATKVTEAWQARAERPVAIPRSFLETLTLGSSAAENEFRDLADYYLEVDAFQRALRGEVRLVVGRKGSGKTALFFQVRDRVRPAPLNIVLDLKPEGYKLLKFKEVVLHLLEQGTVEHTLVAFWEYLLLLEICRKLLESDQVRHTRDQRLYAPYRRLADTYEDDEYVSEGDFSERMTSLLQQMRADFDLLPAGQSSLSQAKLTELLYRHDVARLRSDVITYLKFKESLWLLFDNIDKGWPTHGIRREDLVIVKSLLDASRKIEQELSKHSIDTHTLVFLRNDVYELLVEETPDRGKDTRVGVDWTDPDLLRELLRRRIIFNGVEGDPSFQELWPQIAVSHVSGEESSQFLIDRCLMRPRSLINLINHCRSSAVNLGRVRIEADDIEKGYSLFSTDLIAEIGLEIRDVMPEAEDVLYAFIDVPSRMSESELTRLLASAGVSDDKRAAVVEMLLWYGVLGIVREDGDVEYVYSVNYDMRLLRARVRRAAGQVMFSINPAFWPGLGLRGGSR